MLEHALSLERALAAAEAALRQYVDVVVSVNDPADFSPTVKDAGAPARAALAQIKELNK